MSKAGGGDGGEVHECPQQEVVLMLMARPYYHDVTMLSVSMDVDATSLLGNMYSGWSVTP